MSFEAFGPGEPDRGVQMVRRVSLETEAHGVRAPAGDGFRALHEAVMAPRRKRFEGDDHHPAFLHPGRTLIVALTDGGVRDPDALAAALALDTALPDLEVDDATLARLGSERAVEMRAAVPRPGDEALVERLVTAETVVRSVALAERLDQLRHIRLWASPDVARDMAEEVRRGYAPVARREGGVFARRYAWLLGRLEAAGGS